MNAEEYINRNTGKPWVNRSEGPDSFDCWGLVIDSFRKLDGIELPQISGYTNHQTATSLAADEAIAAGHYIPCHPHDGAIMIAKFNGKITHVGRCLAGGVLHCGESLGVRFDKYRVIKATNQHVEYIKYAPNTAS